MSPLQSIRVSVLIPTYNRAVLLEGALCSVLNQTFEDFEVHILDDGSTDATQAVVIGLNDARLHHHMLTHSGRLSRLRNLSVELANGEYVAFLDSDDHWSSNKLERQIAYLDSRHEFGFCVTEVDRITEDGRSRGGIYMALHDQAIDGICEAPKLESLLSGKFVIYPSSMVVRRSAILDIGGFDERLLTGDSECFFRLAHAYSGGMILDPLVKIHSHATNYSKIWKVDAYDEMLQALDYFCELQAIDAKWASTLRLRYSALREQAIAAGGSTWTRLGPK